MERLVGALRAFIPYTVGAAIGFCTAPTGLMITAAAGELSPVAGRVVSLEPETQANWADVKAPMAIDDLTTDPWVSDLPRALAATLELRSALVIPLVAQNLTIGALVLASTAPRTYRTAAIEHITSISAAIIPLVLGSERLGHLLSSLLRAESAGSVTPVLSNAPAHDLHFGPWFLEPRALSAVFQPIVRLLDRRVVGFEGLSRFSGAPGQAADLFGGARASLWGHRMELRALEAVLLAARKIPDHFILSVNLSPLVALHPAARELLLAQSRALVVELTEYHATTPAMDVELHGLRGSGIQLAVDDAGSGYSTLTRILRLRPEVIKLDRELVADLEADPVRQTFVTAFVRVAGQTGATLIAEGVETESQSQILAQLGVEYAQGYAFGHPAAVDDLFPDSPGGGRPS